MGDHRQIRRRLVTWQVIDDVIAITIGVAALVALGVLLWRGLT